MTLDEYKQNKYTCTKFSSVKYPTNKISSVNFFNNYKKHLSQTNKLFRTILNFSFFSLGQLCKKMDGLCTLNKKHDFFHRGSLKYKK